VIATVIALGAVARAQTINGWALCGHIDGTVAITTKHLSCKTGRYVAGKYLDSNLKRAPEHFKCHRYTVQAAAGWQATCKRSKAVIQITPE
jgi:hypothetical protein